MKCLKVIYKHKSIFIGKPEEFSIEAKEVLKNGLMPLEFSEEFIGTFKISGKIIKGIPLGETSEEVLNFEKRYEIKTENVRHYRRKKRKKMRYSKYFDVSYEKFLKYNGFSFYSFNGDMYIIKKDAEFINLFKWIEEKGKITPKVCGFFKKRYSEKFYFYYSGSSEDGKSKLLKIEKDFENIPSSLLKIINKEYGYVGIEHFNRGYDEKKEELIDFLPFPPYEIIGAVKLLPPKEVLLAKKEKPPEKIFNDIYILKTFLFSEKPVPVIELNKGQLKGFIECVQMDIFDPKIISEEDEIEVEYNKYWNLSNGYVLLCKPKWPF
jgi:hypothetical protein